MIIAGVCISTVSGCALLGWAVSMLNDPAPSMRGFGAFWTLVGVFGIGVVLVILGVARLYWP